jgi:predicted dithiol-disulfide oxidoreductase (DUF899 family)
MCATFDRPGHEARVLEYVYVLGHRGLRQVKAARRIAHGRRPAREDLDEMPARGVGQRGEAEIERCLIVRHMVYYTKMLHEIRFPGETDEYRRARDELLRDEIDLRRQVEAVARTRRELPLGAEVPVDYTFAEWDPGTGSPSAVALSDLFADGKDVLFIYSFMFKPDASGRPLTLPCPLCTSIIDGIDGAVPHITERINLAVVTKAPIERFLAHAQARGWRHARLLSCAGTTYNEDYHAESSDADQFAMATVFARRDGKIHHAWSSELWFVAPEPTENPRHVDFMWPLWAVLDRTPDGRGTDWWPQLSDGRPVTPARS